MYFWVLFLLSRYPCGPCGSLAETSSPTGQSQVHSIVRTYRQGDLVPVVLQFTQDDTYENMLRICPDMSKGWMICEIGVMVNEFSDVTEQCLDKHPVATHDGQPTITITSSPSRSTFNLLFRLPPGLQCSRWIRPSSLDSYLIVVTPLDNGENLE